MEAHAGVGFKTTSYKPGNQKRFVECQFELYSLVVLFTVSLKSIWFISFILMNWEFQENHGYKNEQSWKSMYR